MSEAFERDVQSRLRSIEDRTRRTETRLTKYLESIGHEANIQRPMFDNGIVTVPSPGCAIRDCLACIPTSWDMPVTFLCEGKVILRVSDARMAAA